MPKSKEFLTSSEDSDSDNEKPKAKKKKVEAAPKAEKKGGGGDGKAKDSGAKSSGSSSSGVKSEKGPSGEIMFPLSRMRYATVSEFRGKKLVSIREYYEKDGEILPGRKGISLSIDQWNALQDVMDDINYTIKTT